MFESMLSRPRIRTTCRWRPKVLLLIRFPTTVTMTYGGTRPDVHGPGDECHVGMSRIIAHNSSYILWLSVLTCGYRVIWLHYYAMFGRLRTFARTSITLCAEGLSGLRPAISPCSLVGRRPAPRMPLSVMAHAVIPQVESKGIVSAHRGGRSWGILLVMLALLLAAFLGQA